MKDREAIIKSYVDAYNRFDVEKMAADLDEAVVFETIQSGVPTLVLDGIGKFKEQAHQTKDYFLERKQTIKAFRHNAGSSEVDIDYVATLAIDFPNGMKKGELLQLTGKSVFEFNDLNKISRLTDIS